MSTTVSAELYLEKAVWPAEPFGFEHAKKTAELAETIGRTLGLDGDELMLCKAAGMFHDLGRQGEFWQPDTGHGVRSAELGMSCLLDHPDWAVQRDFVRRMGRIIAQHSIIGPRPTDPVAVALHDADILEAARLVPGTPEGVRIVRQRYARLITPFARNRQVQEHFIRTRPTAFQAGEKWSTDIPKEIPQRV